jgi:CheY-like chemotaxis protein
MAPTPFTILVVDECPAVRLFVDLAVGSDAVRVVGAANGHAALASVECRRPDLVLAATGLTGLGGHDLAARLSSRGVPVVLVTGSLTYTAAEEGTAAAGVLSKPLRADQLRAVVSEMMTTRQDAPAPDDNAALPDAAEPDVIDAWLRDADPSFGSARQARSLASEADALHPFVRDVAALRDGRVIFHPLQISHHGYAAG